jgi:hypothetical protein
MSPSLERYMNIMDSLLEAGDAGQLLRPDHTPHIKSTCIWGVATIGHHPVAQHKVEIALPPVLLSGFCHVAEVDLHSRRIHYRRILDHQESRACTDLLFLQEAQAHVQLYWLDELHTVPGKGCSITQTRSVDGKATWKVYTPRDNMQTTSGKPACKIQSITHQSQFMELARVAKVNYTD